MILFKLFFVLLALLFSVRNQDSHTYKYLLYSRCFISWGIRTLDQAYPGHSAHLVANGNFASLLVSAAVMRARSSSVTSLSNIRSRKGIINSYCL